MKIVVDTDELKEVISNIAEEAYYEECSRMTELQYFMDTFDSKLRLILWGYEMKAMAKENSKTS